MLLSSEKTTLFFLDAVCSFFRKLDVHDSSSIGDIHVLQPATYNSPFLWPFGNLFLSLGEFALLCVLLGQFPSEDSSRRPPLRGPHLVPWEAGQPEKGVFSPRLALPAVVTQLSRKCGCRATPSTLSQPQGAPGQSSCELWGWPVACAVLLLPHRCFSCRELRELRGVPLEASSTPGPTAG